MPQQSQPTIFTILTEPTGALLFFLVAFILSQAALFIALGQRARGTQERTAGRYMVAALGVIGAWLVLMIGTLATNLLNLPPNAVQPPLERTVHAAIFVIIGWGFATADSPVDEGVYNLFVGGVLALLGVALTATVILWSRALTPLGFNASIFGLVWAAIPLAGAAIGVGMLFTRARMVQELPLKLVFFLITGAGYVFTLLSVAGFVGAPLIGDDPGAARLALLVAIPLWPVVIYRFVIRRLGSLAAKAESRARLEAEPQMIVPLAANNEVGDGSDTRESVAVLKALGDMIEREAPADIPLQIVKAAVNALKADVAVLIALDDPEYADVVAAWDNVQQKPIAALALKLAEQPSLINAINARDQRALKPERNLNELVDLYTRLDIQRAGPAYYQALSKDGQTVGALIVALPYTGRELRENEQNLLTALAPIAARLYTISRSALRTQSEAPQRAVADAIREVGDETGAMRIQLQSTLEESRGQIYDLNNRVRELQIELDYERSRLAEFVGEDSEGSSITQRIQLLSVERSRLAEERQKLADAVQEAQTRILGASAWDDGDAYESMIEVLSKERDDLQAQKFKLESELDDLRKRGGSVPPPLVLRKVLTNLSEEKARLQADRDGFAAQLSEVNEQLKALGIEGPGGLAQILAQLTEERAHYKVVAERALQDREVLIEERKRLSDQIAQEAAREAKMNALEGAVRRLAADREALMTQRDQLRQSYSGQQSEIEKWQAERADFIAEAEALQIDMEETIFERDRLQSELSRMVEFRAALEKERDRLAAERTTLQTERDQLSAASDGSREMLQRVGAEGVEQLRGMIDELTEERSELEHKLLRATAQIDSLKDNLQKTRTRLERSIPVPEGINVDATEAEVMMSIAQELRTPMSSIVGYVDLMLTESVGSLGVLQRQFLGRVKANADRLNTLLEDFIKITAIDTGEFHLQPTPVDLLEVIDDAITSTRTQFREKGITLKIDVPESLPALIGDRDALQQVMIQLLSNAYLATRTDGAVQISARAVQDYALPTSGKATDQAERLSGTLISVRDQGLGIAPEEQQRVFSRLYRAENPLILGLGDTGVGLSIARALVEMHGGRIWLDSVPGVGSTFKLILPLRPASAQAALLPAGSSQLADVDANINTNADNPALNGSNPPVNDLNGEEDNYA